MSILGKLFIGIKGEKYDSSPADVQLLPNLFEIEELFK